MQRMKSLIIGGAVLLAAIGGVFIFIQKAPARDSLLSSQPNTLYPMNKEQNTVAPSAGARARFETSMGDFTLALYTKEMPITTGNFMKLAQEGFYDGTRFHRVIEGFMIQGGDPLTKDESQMAAWGTGGPDATIQDEFVLFSDYSNTRGTISMANTGAPNSGGSQFFINVVDNTPLDFNKPEPPFNQNNSKHPVFGRVIDGMDVVDAISTVPVTQRENRPEESVIIKKVVIE
jgi:peptidylprolyl isomerase